MYLRTTSILFSLYHTLAQWEQVRMCWLTNLYSYLMNVVVLLSWRHESIAFSLAAVVINRLSSWSKFSPVGLSYKRALNLFYFLRLLSGSLDCFEYLTVACNIDSSVFMLHWLLITDLIMKLLSVMFNSYVLPTQKSSSEPTGRLTTLHWWKRIMFAGRGHHPKKPNCHSNVITPLSHYVELDAIKQVQCANDATADNHFHSVKIGGQSCWMGSKLWISSEYNKNLADCFKKT